MANPHGIDVSDQVSPRFQIVRATADVTLRPYEQVVYVDADAITITLPHAEEMIGRMIGMICPTNISATVKAQTGVQGTVQFTLSGDEDWMFVSFGGFWHGNRRDAT